ncbi:Membrane associated serine protease, rhomboid family [Shimia gijangensis]|uniref:Membrane associated serine protease, rhomboid family n=1 Tax=Shimia gijangensis TaxID=1470563 RepID=A0A1M6IW25_9RHOB|nr:rhomboid family intramembrane serine protease [Shimia gijangensis]SHJ38628.1 Membrane associated serine protease, rhomboid family [Shimia gijangensis]
MFPIRDHNPSGRAPYVVYALMALNIGIFVMYVPILNEPYKLGAFFHDWALIPHEVTDGSDPFGLITSMFLHGGWMHLAGNMLFLWIFGDNLEDVMGHFGFALFYTLCGLAAGLAQVISDPYSQIPTVGASGAIAGIMGGYLLLFPKARVDVIVIFIVFFKIFALPAWVMLGLWFLWQIFSGVLTDTSGGGVAYWAHAGGFVAGLILTLPVWIKRGGAGFWKKTQGAPPHPETKYAITRSTIPTVRRRK